MFEWLKIRRRKRIGSVPNVVVVILDDIACADLDIYSGDIETPYLSQLAEAGVTFNNCYSHAWCAPSRRSILFGKWQQGDSGGLCSTTSGPGTPTTSDVSIAAALSAHASALIGKWHCGNSPTGSAWQQAPIEHGFDYWAAGVPGNISADQPCGAPSNATYTNWLRVDADASSYSVTTSTTYHGYAVRDVFINGWPTAPRPSLAVVTPQLPHAPFHAPPSALLPPGHPTPATNREKFEAMVIAADKLIGQMLAHTDIEDTLIFVVGDNGTPPNAGGGPKSKGTCFERGVKVPLLVAGGPVANGGRTCSDLVHVVDVYATALAACNVTPGGDGHSFLPVLNQTTWVPRTHVFIGNRWEDTANLPNERAAVSSLGWKLRQLDNDGDGDVDAEELYDLVNDPTEATNVISANPTVASAIRTWLEAAAP